MLIGLAYCGLEPVGSLPLVVYRISVPDSLELKVTDWLEVYVPPAGKAETMGGSLSIVYIWLCTLLGLSAVSLPKYFKVVVVETEIDEM